MFDAKQPPIEPIHRVQHIVHTVERWPERTAFTEDWLTMAHANSATVDGDLVTFDLFNGGGAYRLRRDLPPEGPAIIADLVPDTARVTRRKVKG